MPKNPLKLKIAYLYPDILRGFCDDANVQTFSKRANWREIEVQIDEIMADDKIRSSNYDFYYIGGSNLAALDFALKLLLKYKDELKIAALSNAAMLAVNCGYALFGNSFQLQNKNQTSALKILNVDSIEQKVNNFGKICGFCDFLEGKTVVGFENHTLTSCHRGDCEPFLAVKEGFGNNGLDKTEGARFNNVIGTYISTPILAQNPHFCDFLINCALSTKYRCKIPLAPLCDDIEWYCHNYLLEKKIQI